MRKLLLLIFISFSGICLKAQTNLDSLFTVWQDPTQPDTTRLKAIDKFAWYGYLFTQPDSAFYYAQLQYDFAESKGIKSQMAWALNTQGYSLAVRSDYSQGLNYYRRSLKIHEEIGNKKGIAMSLNNIGIIYKKQEDYTQGLN